ncbi:hypothetical protein SH1V18_28730 [Vallitalea longa]|uniref:DUF1611 domain-containing protein n=1 Tax=Vallitalea longa TaxID=2936439 RepID=A0A9W6DGE9_9FIRM|nr:S8 family serine peptidase [Vallitalea longa]GKX30393.1 hypothetical protein SH1V18_28730 [Vallitalea longa]
MENKKVKIAIVDSGLRKGLIPSDVTNFINLKLNNNGGLIIDENCMDNNGHGTAIYSIVEKVNQFSDITVIKIFDENEYITEDTLIKALEFINENLNINIINLSLGLNICDKYNEFYDICEKLKKKGTIIISAFDNAGCMSYPAVFDNVIGVTSSNICKRVNDFEYFDDEILNIGAKGSIQRVAWVNPKYLMIGGNSFACAHVTVQVAKFMREGVKLYKDILEKFKDIAINSNEFNFIKDEKKVFEIKNAILFPFNKEMHSLIRYENLLEFNIIDIYDIKYSAKINASTQHIMKDRNVKDYKIKNIEDIDWKSFDTLIMGHTVELSDLTKLTKGIIREAISREKNLYIFDDIKELKSIETRKNIFIPRVSKDNVIPNRFGKLFRISKPVIGVFGTSSRQGKFTLQLKLREILLNYGYNIGQIGTEPSALLYGMDYVYPMGYNSSVYIKEFDTIRYLNNCINQLCIEDKDLIIVGSQSGTIPYDTGNLALYNIPQFNFIMGTQPDVVLLCVNFHDDFDYIERTIKFIESSVDCKVISLIVFPMKLKNDWMGMYGGKEEMTFDDFEAKCQLLRKRFNVDIYKLGNEEHMKRLVDLIIQYFSKEY